MSSKLLEVRNLKVQFDTYGGVVQAVRGVDFSVDRGQTLAIVGESGCGKSVTVQALMGLTPTPPGKITSGSVLFEGKEIFLPAQNGKSGGLNPALASAIRGKKIGMIFQDPMTSLNPTMTVGKQIAETLRFHDGVDFEEGRKRAIELLEQVQIPEAATRVDQYPHQFSGGMRQRVMIAMAIACNPTLLIADEPTTALDVTVQAQILQLIRKLQRERQMAVILITHDLGVVAQMSDQVNVMYAGQVVESGSVDDIFYRSSHPYTLGLRSAMPEPKESPTRERLVPIEGSPPDLFSPPQGCGYAPRCPHAMKVCDSHLPPLGTVESSHQARCWLHHPHAGAANSPVYRKNPILEASASTPASGASPS